MDIEFLENYCEEKGVKITNIIVNTYDSADFELDSRQIEGEIYDISLSYAKILFFESEKFLSEETRLEIKSHLSQRYSKPKFVNDVDLIAHWIKLEAIQRLERKSLFLL